MKLLFLLICSAFATLTLDKETEVTTDAANSENFSGSMQVGGVEYDVTCDCSEQSMEAVEEVKCHPTKIKLTQDREGRGATYEEISAKLSSAGNYTYARVTHTSFRCLDGRITDPILGTPGGDAGEFVLGLLVYEDMSGKELDLESVETYLHEYLRCMDATKLYMCTDDHAISHIEKELAIENLDIFSPRPSIKDQVLNAVSEPENVGDSHLRLMLQYPDLYSINPKVVQNFLKAFYKLLWDDENALSDTLYLEVLPGNHNETAFLDVRTNEECNFEQVAPLMTPREGGPQNQSIFINHLDSVSIRRAQIAQFFAEKIARNRDGITADKMHSRMNHHGLFFLDVTGSYIAKDLPFYTSSFV